MARLSLIGTAACFLLVVTLLHGDEKPTTKDDKQTAKPGLPVYFEKLSLTESQRRRVKAIRETYENRIKDLEEQLRGLRKKERADMENVLTDDQKEKLQQLRKDKAQTLRSSKDEID